MSIAPPASVVLPALKADCRHYRGDRPCAVGVQGVCPAACGSYAPPAQRILIIKLAALGDVIRTASLPPTLRRLWPGAHITWVSRPSGVRALSGHPAIDRLLPFDAESIAHLEIEHFDLLLSLDKEPGPAALAMRIHASDKRGVGLSRYGTPIPLNPAAAEYFALGLDDHAKFALNQRTYPELIHAALDLPHQRERYTLHPSAADAAHADAVWARLGVAPGEPVVGLNTGAGRGFANKSWPPQRFAALARRLLARGAVRVALLGGADERSTNAALAAATPGLLNTGAEHSELEFAAVVSRCQVVVSGDTMAMHVAIAAGVPCVTLFGPTCPQEIDLFDRGERIVTSLPCSPCYKRRCSLSPNCMDDIDVERVLEAVDRWLPQAAAPRSAPLPQLAGAGA